MKLISFEKRDATHYEEYIVLRLFGKEYSIPSDSGKAMVLFWLFCAIVFFGYSVGKYDAYQSVMFTAWLSQGNLTNSNGTHISCNVSLDETKTIVWKCEPDKYSAGQYEWNVLNANHTWETRDG